jgi:hypothetical protein
MEKNEIEELISKTRHNLMVELISHVTIFGAKIFNPKYNNNIINIDCNLNDINVNEVVNLLAKYSTSDLNCEMLIPTHNVDRQGSLENKNRMVIYITYGDL